MMVGWGKGGSHIVIANIGRDKKMRFRQWIGFG